MQGMHDMQEKQAGRDVFAELIREYNDLKKAEQLLLRVSKLFKEKNQRMHDEDTFNTFYVCSFPPDMADDLISFLAERR